MNWLRKRYSGPAGRCLAVLAALMLVFAVACGEDDDNNDSNDNNESNETRDAGNNNNTNNNNGEDGGNNNGEDGGDNNEDDGGNNNDEDGGNNNGGDCEPESSMSDDDECSVLCQDCDEGQACVTGQDQEGNTINACQPEGEGTQGDECGQQSPCATGYICVGESEDDLSCQQVCRPESDEEPQCSGDAEEASCAPLQGSEDIGACIGGDDECEPYPEEDECGSGETCWFSGAGNECVSYDEDASAGESCSDGSDCNDQQSCIQLQDDNEPTCYEHCDPDGDDCPSGTQCGGVGQDANNPDAYICVEAQ